MKKTILYISLIVFFTSCANNKNTSTAPKAGNERDAHNCISSAGYKWSELKNDCVRSWEAGIQFDPSSNRSDKTSIASVLFLKGKAEVFASELKKPVVLTAVKNGNILFEGYLLNNVIKFSLGPMRDVGTILPNCSSTSLLRTILVSDLRVLKRFTASIV